MNRNSQAKEKVHFLLGEARAGRRVARAASGCAPCPPQQVLSWGALGAVTPTSAVLGGLRRSQDSLGMDPQLPPVTAHSEPPDSHEPPPWGQGLPLGRGTPQRGPRKPTARALAMSQVSMSRSLKKRGRGELCDTPLPTSLSPRLVGGGRGQGTCRERCWPLPHLSTQCLPGTHSRHALSSLHPS